jgi:hypothetical protein
MRRLLVGITVQVTAQTPAAPSKPVPLDTASLKKVVGGSGSPDAPHRGW